MKDEPEEDLEQSLRKVTRQIDALGISKTEGGEVYVFRALLLCQLDCWDAALADFLAATRRGQSLLDDEETYFRYAEALYECRKYSPATALFKDLAQSKNAETATAAAWMLTQITYLKTPLDQKLTRLALRIKSDAKDFTAYSERAILRYSAKDYNGCIADCAICIENDPDDPGNLVQRGRAYMKLGLPYKARDDFNEAHEVNQDPELIPRIWQRQQEAQQAIDELKSEDG